MKNSAIKKQRTKKPLAFAGKRSQSESLRYAAVPGAGLSSCFGTQPLVENRKTLGPLRRVESLEERQGSSVLLH